MAGAELFSRLVTFSGTNVTCIVEKDMPASAPPGTASGMARGAVSARVSMDCEVIGSAGGRARGQGGAALLRDLGLDLLDGEDGAVQLRRHSRPCGRFCTETSASPSSGSVCGASTVVSTPAA